MKFFKSLCIFSFWLKVWYYYYATPSILRLLYCAIYIIPSVLRHLHCTFCVAPSTLNLLYCVILIKPPVLRHFHWTFRIAPFTFNILYCAIYIKPSVLRHLHWTFCIAPSTLNPLYRTTLSRAVRSACASRDEDEWTGCPVSYLLHCPFLSETRENLSGVQPKQITLSSVTYQKPRNAREFSIVF